MLFWRWVIFWNLSQILQLYSICEECDESIEVTKCEVHGVKKIEMWVSKHGGGSDDRSVLQSDFRRVQKVQNKAPIGAKLKTKDGAVFHTFNHAIQVIFKVSFFWFVDAPVLCILIPIKNPTYPPTIEPTKPQIKPENMKMTYYIKRKKWKLLF